MQLHNNFIEWIKDIVKQKKLHVNIDILETPYENEYGKIEKRTYHISYDTNCIHNKKKWQSVTSIGRMDI